MSQSSVGKTRIHIAAQSNDVTKMKRSLAEGDDVNRKHEFGRTPLHMAALMNKGQSHEVMELLLTGGADANAFDSNMQTPLHLLIPKANRNMVNLFLNSGFSVNIINLDGQNVLFLAVVHDNVDLVQLLINRGSNVNHRDNLGRTPLHVVATKNTNDSHFEVAEILLKKGADANAKDKEGQTPLFYLIKNGNIRIFRLFLKFKANIKEVNKSKCNLLFPEFNQFRNLEIYQELINSGLDVNHRNNIKITPLHSVVQCTGSEMLMKVSEILLKNGADVNARDKSGLSPFYYLIQRISFENWKIVELFLKFNADVNQGDDTGKTILHRTFSVLDFTMKPLLKPLLKIGANVNAVDNAGFTPLLNIMYLFSHAKEPADVKNDEKILKLVLDCANLNIIHSNERTKNVLSYIGQSDYSLTLLLQHLAKLKTLDVPLHPELWNHAVEKYNRYLKLCEAELLRAKNIKLKHCWTTVYDLLIGDRKKLKNYAGNKDLIKDFNKINFAKQFPIYAAWIGENMKKGIKRRKLFDKSSVGLSNCLPVFNPTHLIIKDILDCVLSKKDLSKLCK